MKNKLTKICAAVLLSASMLAAGTQASAFNDIKSTGYSWASDAIDDVAERGIVSGYTDGTFRPGGNVTVTELLVMLARMCNADTYTQKTIYNDYKSFLTGLFGTNLSWAHEYFATCIASGIITKNELSALKTNNSLSSEASKELLSVFVVRAMQLEDKATELKNYTIDFKDADSITALRKPYVYVLSNIGVVTGNTKNEFEPKSNVTRAVTATMLSRAVAYMEDNGIEVDFGEYSERYWESGTITEISGSTGSQVLLTMSTESDDTKSALIDSDAQYYLNGEKSTVSALMKKYYVNICRANDGTALEVRVTSKPKTISGTVVSATKSAVQIETEDGVKYKFEVKDYTEVSNPKNYGDADLIEKSAAIYQQADCKVNSQNELLYVNFYESTEDVFGTISAIKTVGTTKTISFRTYKGLTYSVEVPSTAEIYEDETLSSLTSDMVGYFTTLKILKSSGSIGAVYIDKDYKVVSGSVRSTSNSSGGYVSIRNVSTAKSTIYYLDKAAEIFYKDNEVGFSKISSGYYATAILDGDKEITKFYAYPSGNNISGTITEISFGTTIKLTICTEQKEYLEFAVNLTDLPKVKRDNEDSTIDKLRQGDAVDLDLELGEIEKIEATSKDAEKSGVITQITQTSATNIITVKESDGSEYDYNVPEGIDITSGGTEVGFSGLKVGYTVSFALREDGETVSLIKINDSIAASDYVRGNVIFINYDSGYILVETYDAKGNSVTSAVYYGAQTKFMKASNGAAAVLENIDISDKIIAIGSYSGTSFNATIIIEL